MGRFPIEGKGKSRLAAELGVQRAHEIHQLLFHHALETFSRCAFGCVMAWAEPLPPDASFSPKVPTLLQRGATLGDRMVNAAQDVQTSTGAEIITLVGTDLPAIDCGDVAWAEGEVRQGFDAAILPAKDGGFGLISMRDWSHHIWMPDMPWGTSEVMELTRAGFRKAGLRWQEGAMTRDVDTASDWQEFCQKHPTFARYGSI